MMPPCVLSQALCVLILIFAVDESRARSPELSAHYWFNNPVFRLHDDRAIVLWFFSLKNQRPGAELERTILTLRRIAANPDVVVIGLTPDRRAAVQRLIRKYGIPFTIGAESRSYRDFGIRRLPALLRIDRRGGDRAEPIEIGDLTELAPDYQRWGSADLAQLTTPWQLRALIESQAEGKLRRAGVGRLYEMSDPQEFAGWAAQWMPHEPDPWVRGALDLYRDRALGIERHDDELSPSAAALREYRANPDAPEWLPVRSFFATRPNSVDELMQALKQHKGNSPVDLVMRRRVVDALMDVPQAQKPQARTALMQLLPGESDPSIRLLATMALGEICQPGDEEVAQLLEALAQEEANTWRVRPMMEYVSYYLRTGEEDARNMPPPLSARP